MRFLTTIFSIALGVAVFAQQGTNFSQWYLNNMQHNPATVGVISQDMRVFTNFRMQYLTVTNKPLRSNSVAIDGKVLKAKHKPHYLGIGAVFNNDATGDARFMVNDFSIPIAYHIFFNEDNFLSIGVAPGLYNRMIKGDGYTWGHQWNGQEFSEDIPGEMMGSLSRMSINTFNLNAGIHFRHQYADVNYFYFGFSANHLTAQNVGIQIVDKMKRSYVGQFGMSHRFEDRDFGISPNVYGMFQWPNMNVIYGLNFDFYLRDGSLRTIFIDPNMISAGIYHRWNEGIILSVMAKFAGVSIGVAYDTNINSMIRHSKSVGAFELSFAYDFIFDKKNKFIF